MFDGIVRKLVHGVFVASGIVFFSAALNHSAVGQSRIEFTNFRFVELKGRPGHEGLFEIDGQPLIGVTHLGAARLDGGVGSAQFRLVNEAGNKLKDINLVLGGHAEASSYEYVGTIELPTVPFRVAVNGSDSAGRVFDVTFPRLFQAQSILVRFDPTSAEVRPGTTLLSGTVTNFGRADTFQLSATLNEFIAAVSPLTLTLNTDQSGRFELQVNVPTDTPELTIVPAAVSATSSTDAGVSNGASVDLFVVRVGRSGRPKR